MFLSLAFIHVFLLRQAQCFKTTHHFWNAYMPARHQALSSWPLRSSISDKEARETAETARARFPHLGDPLGIPNEVDADEMPTSTFVSYLKPQAEPLDICAAVALCLKDSSNLSRARDLLSIGAVWSYENRSSIVKSQGNSINPNNSTKDGAGKWRRVRFDSSSGAVLASGTALRVYGTPRRFLGCYVGDWRSRLLHTDSAYVVVDKPPKLPCQPDNANLAESLPACTLRALAPLLAPKSSKKKLVSEETVRPLELLLVHRLDTNTEGCTVLARNRKAQAQFKQWLSSRKVTKEYVCLSRGQRLGQGLKRHWMLSPGPSSSSSDDMSYDQVVGPGPRLLRKTAPPPVSAQASPLTSSPSPNRKKASKGKGKPKDDLSLAPCPAPLGLSWKPCTLEVLSCEPFNFGSSSSFSSDGLEDGTSSATGEKLFETRVRLLTGRTHQVLLEVTSCMSILLLYSFASLLHFFLINEVVAIIVLYQHVFGGP